MDRKYGLGATSAPLPGSTGAAASGNIPAMNPLRVTSLAILAAAALLLVLDALETLVAANWNGMATGYLWSIIWPSSLTAVKRFVEGNISVALWQRILLPVLSLPLWAMLLALGGILFFAGKKDDVTP
jgi:hypothetical protein